MSGYIAYMRDPRPRGAAQFVHTGNRIDGTDLSTLDEDRTYFAGFLSNCAGRPFQMATQW